MYSNLIATFPDQSQDESISITWHISCNGQARSDLPYLCCDRSRLVVYVLEKIQKIRINKLNEDIS